MGFLFHGATLSIAALSWAILHRHPRHGVWLAGAAGVASLGLLAAASASRGSLFALMRFACWLVFAYFPIQALVGAYLLRAQRRTSRTLMAIAGAVGVLGLWVFVIEPRWLEVSHHTVTSPKLDRAIRVVVLTDLQTDHIGAYERRALATVMDQQPDLIVLPGDYLQIGDPEARRRQARALRDALKAVDFRAPLGVYAVRGDVEHDDWHSIFAGTRVQTSEKTSRIERPEIVLTALSPRDARYRRAWPRRTERFHIAFGHAPEFAIDQALLDKPSADLLIAGHTHGGQVRLPIIGPLITFSGVPRAWAAGRTDFTNGATLIVSRGVGMERGPAPRLRFLCRPEIVVIDLVPSGADR